MNKYVKKPIVIEAFRIEAGALTWNPPKWLLEALLDGLIKRHPDGGVVIHTLEGDMIGDVGDWMIRGVKGELYPCKNDIFEASYSAVPEVLGQ